MLLTLANLSAVQALISVIVPVYNVAPYLRQCVDSILSQSYTHLEVLLIDDGSTDESGAICDEYAQQDSRVKVIHKPNGGLSSARNVGLSLASGEWISFVDSDDWLDTNIYQKCIDELERYPDLDLVRFFVNYAYLDEDTNSYRLEPFREAEKSLKINQSACFRYPKRIPAVVWSSIYKTSMLKSLELTFIEGLLHEDEFFTAELYARVKSLKGHYIPYVGYYYRQNRAGAIMYERDALKSCDHLCKGFIYVLKRLQSIDPDAIPLLNMHFLTILMEEWRGYRRRVSSVEELVLLMRPFFQESYKHKLKGVGGKQHIFLRCFRLNPILTANMVRLYRPIGHLLGRIYI